MEKLAHLLTGYIIRKGMADESQSETYEYGFLIALEALLSIIISAAIAIQMDMILECILFFVIFIPIRVYAGGLHFNKYLLCLICSVLTLLMVLSIVKYTELDGGYSMIISGIMLMMIINLSPVDNVNRDVDETEQSYFKKKLTVFVVLDAASVVILYLCSVKEILFLIALTLSLIVFTMMLGKVKYRVEKNVNESNKTI